MLTGSDDRIELLDLTLMFKQRRARLTLNKHIEKIIDMSEEHDKNSSDTASNCTNEPDELHDHAAETSEKSAANGSGS